MKTLLTLLFITSSLFSYSQTHLMVLNNGIAYQVDILKEDDKTITILNSLTKKEKTIKKSKVSTLKEIGEESNHYDPYKLNDNGILFLDYISYDSTMTKDQFFTKSKSWIARAFKDGKEVDIHSDKKDGVIIGKGTVLAKQDVLIGDKTYLNYTINIFCKNGKAKIVIDNIGSQLVGNQFANPNNITPLELQYWKGEKIRNGFQKDKAKKAKAILSIIESWKNAVKNNSSDYSNF